jgi:hypothetical protein
MASQTQIETTTCTTLSFHLMPLGITLKQTSSRKQRTLHVTKPKRTVRIGSVRLPKWFLQRQYDLQLLYATSGWPLSLSACSIVPHDSPFFEACRDGDIEMIKFLLSNQQASIYDRTPGGYTSLQSAISCGQLEVCKLLRHAGIFAQFDDDDYRKCICSLQWILSDFTAHNYSLLRVLAPLNDPGRHWVEEYCRTSTDDGRMVIHADIELFSLLKGAQRDTSMQNMFHLRAYFECRISNACFDYRSFMPYIAKVLSDASTICEITAARDRYAWIVYALANEIAHAYLWKPWPFDAEPRSVRQALRAAVMLAGLDPHQTSGRLESPFISDQWYNDVGITPLGLLCVEAMRIRVALDYGSQSWWNKDVNARLRMWLSGLHSAGVDILQYAESESECYGCAPNSLVIPWNPEGSITIVTGLRPEDWLVSFWQPCESHVRLFWCWVEGEPVVPGLTARILDAYYTLTQRRDPTTCCDLPGSWPSSGEVRITEELESWLLRRTDDVLAQIEEDLALLSESDFFANWYRIDDVLRAKAVDEVRRSERPTAMSNHLDKI